MGKKKLRIQSSIKQEIELKSILINLDINKFNFLEENLNDEGMFEMSITDCHKTYKLF